MSSTTGGPTVLDFDVDDDRERIMIGAETDDVSIVVETSREIDPDQLRALLEDVPDSIAVVDELLKGGSE
jgi:hypothetical protein